MQRYESYKPSGLDWLGDIPSQWNLKKSKFLWREKEDRSLLGDEELLSVSQYSGVVPRAEDSRSESLEDYKRCEPNDLVINIMLAWMSGLGVSKYSGIVSPAYCVYQQLEDHNPSYFDYLYRSPQYLGEFARRSKGIVPSRWRMYTEDFGQVLGLLPPREEQDRIVAFLDQKTAEIDAAIAKKERLLDLLREQKRILITEAVTHGLNVDVARQSTGVEWLGKIPAHWSIVRFKRCFSIIKDGLHHTPIKRDEGVNFVSTQHVRNRQINIQSATKISHKDYALGHPRIKPEAGDVLITLVGSIGFAATVRCEHLPLSCTRHVGYVRPIESKINRDFLLYYTESAAFASFIDKNISKTAQPSIYLSSISNHEIALPPLVEQQQIVDWLDQRVGPYEQIFNSVSNQITQMESLKLSLIAQVVTGKIKV